jgi:hypothetical protein
MKRLLFVDRGKIDPRYARAEAHRTCRAFALDDISHDRDCGQVSRTAPAITADIGVRE